MSQTTSNELAKSFEPADIEARWYPVWESRGYFKAGSDPAKPGFAIQLPPPNITGILHMGHAFNQTVMDSLTRYYRMQGYNTLWLPGTDHAGIATQIVVERQLQEEGTDRRAIGREAFISKIWEWQKYSGGTILNQMRRLGDSLDWSRLYFTMDDKLSKVVKKTFVQLYREGLIYRGKRLVNWDPKLQSAVSDLEVESEEAPGHLWEIRYPAADGGEGVIVATTRPETLFGDQAVAVHPEDERYKHLVGKMLKLPLTDRLIPVIADEYVDREFGSGCVKITPAHDFNDFEVGKRHNLEMLNILTKTATMNDNCPEKYRDMDRYACRKACVEDLKAQGLLVGIKDIKHMVPRVTRTGEVVEPMLSEQWYMAMSKPAPEGSLFPGKSIGEVGLEAVTSGEVNIFPKEWQGVYRQWLENIQDWCISRQLWWGHQIPVWYCDDCGKSSVSREDITECQHCHSKHIHRDPDVLDTWFSSALWPFSTMGWPDKTPDIQQFFPTSVLVTGYDIIFFWVARMMFMTCEFMKEIPFKNVFIHGLVRDSQGRKMSKSLGNGIDPLGVCEQYGADALRFTLVTGNTPGNDMRFYMERVEANRNFANKIWNASKFVIMNLGDFDETFIPEDKDLTLADRWILTSFNETVAKVTEDLDKFELGDAADAVYNFIWNSYCDWYIELAKKRLYQAESERDKHTVQYVLVYVLTHTLEMLHPFMPFVTEHLWQHLPHEGESIIVAPWPKTQDKWNFPADAATMNTMMEAIKGIRNLRAESNVPMGKKAPVILAPATEDMAQTLKTYEDYFHTLAFADKVTLLGAGDAKPENAVVAVVPGIEVYLQLKDLIDVEKETARVQKEQEKLQKEIARLDKKLSNQGFLSKAPVAVVEKEKGKLADYQEKMAALTKRMEDLAKL